MAKLGCLGGRRALVLNFGWGLWGVLRLLQVVVLNVGDRLLLFQSRASSRRLGCHGKQQAGLDGRASEWSLRTLRRAALYILVILWLSELAENLLSSAAMIC